MKRVFQDGDHLFAHTVYDLPIPVVAFDVFRTSGGRIVEHWDNVQVVPSNAQSNQSMIHGPQQPGNIQTTEPNKALVRRFVQDVLIGGKRDRLEDYFEGNTLIQHSGVLADTVSELLEVIGSDGRLGAYLQYDRLHTILGEGSFVLAVSEGRRDGQPVSIYDLYRVRQNKLFEHWDVIEALPPVEKWTNPNGKFRFPKP